MSISRIVYDYLIENGYKVNFDELHSLISELQDNDKEDLLDALMNSDEDDICRIVADILV